MHVLKTLFATTALLTTLAAAAPSAAPKPWDHGRLRVDSTGRALVHEKGQPFFWMGDCAWEFFHRSTREEVDRYLADRAAKRFNVIQSVAVPEFGAFDTPNAYGHLPFEPSKVYPGGDMGVPRVRPGANDDYWDHINYIVDRAAEHGIYICYVVSWGTHITPARAVDEHNAHAFGSFIGRALKDKPNIIYMLGCDRDAEVEGVDYRPVWRLIAQGIKDADPNHLMSYLTKYQDARYWFEGESWLDFNMIQFRMPHDTWDVHNLVSAAYAKKPPMPALNVECNLDGDGFYHGSSVGAAACRREFYWYVFSGAFGHTYGHLSLITWWDNKRPYRVWFDKPTISWHEALDTAGAREKKFARDLMESRPLLGRVPDPALIAYGHSDKTDHLEACRGEGYAYVFTPTGKTFVVTLGLLTGDTLRAWWFDPRRGAATEIGTFPNRGSRTFDPPGEPGLGNDWILVLDDTAREYPAPGSRDHAQTPAAASAGSKTSWRASHAVARASETSELLEDGGFERGGSAWALNGAEVAPAAGARDTAGLRMTLGAWRTAEQRVAAKPHARYTISGALRVSECTAGVGMVALFRDAAGREIGRRNISQLQGTRPYSRHTAHVVTPAQTEYIDLRLYAREGGTGEASFDDLSLTLSK